MCSGSWNIRKLSSSPAAIRQQQQKKKPHVSMTLRRKRLRLVMRRELRRAAGAEMEMLNLKLHLENRRILAENEKLREKASALRSENLALRADLCNAATAVVLLQPVEAAHGC